MLKISRYIYLFAAVLFLARRAGAGLSGRHGGRRLPDELAEPYQPGHMLAAPLLVDAGYGVPGARSSS